MYSLIYFPRPFKLDDGTISDSNGTPLLRFKKPYRNYPLHMQEILDCLNSSDDECFVTDEDYDLSLKDNDNMENNGKSFLKILVWESLSDKFDFVKAEQIQNEFVWWIIKKLTKQIK